MSTEIEIVEMPKSHYVSFCDKLRDKTGLNTPIKSNELVEKTETVFQAGYEKGKSEGGTSSDNYYDTFWDANQQNGQRIHYGSAYSSPTSNMCIWTDSNFSPKYDMRPTTIASMFGYSDIEDIKGIFEKLGRVFDTSNCTDFTQAFRGSAVVYPPDLDLIKAPHLNGTFNSCKKVKAITLKNVQSTMTYVNNPFRDCEQLTDVSIEGTIGSTVSFADSRLLSDTSINNVISCLADLTGQTAHTLTLHADVKSKLSDEQIASITAKNWTLA